MPFLRLYAYRTMIQFNCDVIGFEVSVFTAHSGQSGSIVCSPNARAMDQAW